MNWLPLLAAAAVTPAPPANILLVTIDTLRADRVGAYGYTGAQTPTLDRLARDGVLVQDAVVQVPQTRPSHASLFTGRLPYEHGLRDNFSPPLPARFPTLATSLRGRGYATAGFVGAYPVSRDSGLDRGFDHFDDPFSSEGKREAADERSERHAGEVVDRALAWLEASKRRPFFAWVHLFDPHAPYAPPAPWRERFAKQPYDGEVAYADSQLARLLAWLDGAGERERTLVVVTSDHGEGLGDHGEDEHLLFVYDTTLRVPLLARWPGRLRAGTRVQGQFRSVDLLPTLLDLLGAPPVPTSGASRKPAFETGAPIPDNESYAESLYGQLHFGYAPLRSLRSGGLKYIEAPRAELYDLHRDPGETRNRLRERGLTATTMQKQLRAHDKTEPAAATAAVDEDAAEKLAALGYLGGAFFSGTSSGDDPKDKIVEFQTHRRETTQALDLFRRRDYAGAARVFERLDRPAQRADGQVVERHSFNVSFYLGRSLLEMRRFDAAIAPLSDALELSPNTVHTYLYLSRAFAGAGRVPEALATAERGLERAPRNAELHQMKGRLLLRRGDVPGGQASLEKASSLAPKNALVAVDLSNLHRNRGDLPRGLAEAERAVRLDARSPETQVALGLALGALEREDEAAAAFRKAVDLAPRHPDALFFLAATELRAGRPDAATALLDRLKSAFPDYPGAAELRAQTGRAASPPAGAFRLRLLRVADRAEAEEALRRLGEGIDFARLAREISSDRSAAQGGDLGPIRVEDLAEPLRGAAAALSPGQWSAILETSDGFVLLKRER
jgi:choline-sulfatase